MHKISQNDLSKFSFVSSIGSIISTCTCKGVLKEFQLQMVLVSKVTWTHHEFKMPIFPSKKHRCSQTNKIHDFDPENKPWKKPNPNAPCMDYLFTYIMWKMARFQGEMVGKYSLHGAFGEEKKPSFFVHDFKHFTGYHWWHRWQVTATFRPWESLQLLKGYHGLRVFSVCQNDLKTVGFPPGMIPKKKHTKLYWNIYWTFAKI